MPGAAVAPAARAAQPGRSWRCGSNYSAGREVGEDRRGRRRLGRGRVWRLQHSRPGGRPPRSVPRTEVSAARLRPEIGVVGGFLASGLNSSRADAYSPARNRWRRLPNLPVTVDHAMAAGRGRALRRRRLRPRAAARHGVRLRNGRWRTLPVDARAARRGRCRRRGREALRRRRRRGARRLARDAFAFDFETDAGR